MEMIENLAVALNLGTGNTLNRFFYRTSKGF